MGRAPSTTHRDVKVPFLASGRGAQGGPVLRHFVMKTATVRAGTVNVPVDGVYADCRTSGSTDPASTGCRPSRAFFSDATVCVVLDVVALKTTTTVLPSFLITIVITPGVSAAPD